MKYFKLVLLFVFLLSLAAYSNYYLASNFDSEIRFVNDPGDRDAYYDRGLWYPLKKIPYLEVFSEYPQIATYFFALPHAILKILYGSDYTREDYYLIFSIFSMIFLFGTIMLLYNLRLENKNFALLMLLPASLYFSYNRYDILPVFLGILGIALLSKEKYTLSALVLALGVLAKWYLILLFPVFLVFYYSRHKKINANMIIVFCLTCVAGILPTILSGGLEALLVPYRFHATRGLNQESLFYLLKSLLGSDLWFFIFFVLQFSVVPLCIFSKIDSIKKVITWSFLSVSVFMLFAKFYSPQWILWILPFLILRAKNTKDVLLIVIFDLVTYIYFPIIYDGYSSFLQPIIIIKTALLLYLIIMAAKDVFPDIEKSFLHRYRVNVGR